MTGTNTFFPEPLSSESNDAAGPWAPRVDRPTAFPLRSVWHLSVSSFPRTAWVQKIKAASELYIETEKKKREKAYLGNARPGRRATGWGPRTLEPRVEGPEMG